MLYDKIRVIKDTQAKATIAMIAFKIASADGTIADSEKAVIDKIKSL
jgi:tellurite resistance protein